MRPNREWLAASLLLVAAARADQAAPAMPDPILTPGAIADTDPAIVCAPSYSRSHRVWRDQTGTLLKYGIPLADRNDYTDDDRVPVGLGGDNASPLNHWAQPWREAEDKDQLEDRLRREVCSGQMTLPAAQAVFLGDWRSRLRTAP